MLFYLNVVVSNVNLVLVQFNGISKLGLNSTDIIVTRAQKRNGDEVEHKN